MDFGERFKGWFSGSEKPKEPELEEAAEQAKEEKTWDVTRQPEMEKKVGEEEMSPEKFGEIVDRAVARLKLSEERGEELAVKVKADQEMMERLTKMAAEQAEGGEKPTDEALEDLVVAHFEKAFADKASINIEDEAA